MSRNLSKFLWLAFVLSAIAILPGCPGAKPAPISGYSPLPAVSVMVIVPDSTSVGTGTTQQFMAMVNNSGVQNVQWEVNGIPSGDGDVGTIDKTGLYTAPPFIPKNPHVTITAQANADNTKSGSANITIIGAQGPATVSISPSTAFLQIGTSITLTATVTGVSNTAVTWLVNNVVEGNTTVGRIVPGENNTAVYTAPAVVPNPATVEITAISNEDPDPTRAGLAEITISKNPPDIANVTISPSLANVQAGHSFPFTATITGISDTSVTWSLCELSNCPISERQAGGDAGTITTGGLYTAPPALPKVNPIFVIAASTLQPSRFAIAAVTVGAPSINGVTITLMPNLVATLPTNSEQDFTATVGNALDTSITWEVNGVKNGDATVGILVPLPNSSTTVQYFSPPQVPAQNPVIISAIPNADPTISATASVNIVQKPIIVMVQPPSPDVQIGTTQQYLASVQNAADETVTWSLVPNSGCDGLVGSISADGLYSAPATLPPSNCNPVIIKAVSNQDHTTFGTDTAILVTVLPEQVTLSATSQSVEVNGQVGLTATVTNAPNNDMVISDWQVNSIGQASGGGNSTFGFVVPDLFNTATYTAPASVPPPVDSQGNGHVTITAVSDADSSKTGSMTLTINPAPPLISVTPIQPAGPVSFLPGQSKTFSAAVNGSIDQVIFWTLSGAPGGCTPTVCGTIAASTDGSPANYTAPQTVPNFTIIVTATADADHSATATDSIIVSESTTLSISISPANPAPIAAGSANPLTFNAVISNAPADTPVTWQLGCISLWDGIHSGCANFDNNGGPGCLEQSPTPCPTGLFANRPTDISIPGNDAASYTAPPVLYTGTFAANSCEGTNDGSGNGQVPLTASVTSGGNQASVTICITVTPP